MLDPVAALRAGEQLERYAAGLPPRERAALKTLLARANEDAPRAALAAEPPATVLSPREAAIFEELRADPSAPRGGRSSMTMIMKATRLCNLRCAYCHSWKAGPNQVMTFPVLARAIRDTLRDPATHYVDFVWHGGEVTLLPPSFLRKALWLQEQFRRPDQTVLNTVQTNGTRLSDDWLTFLRRYRFGVGVSLDGPPEVHDRRRVDVAGRPTSARVREGLARLRGAGIRDTGVLMVVDEAIIALGARRVLDYLLETGVGGVALLNVLPENTPPDASPRGAYLPLPRYVDFLRDLFRLWWSAHADRIKIRELGTLVDQLAGRPPRICIFAGDCFGGYLTVEPTGEVSACDKYIGDADYTFGTVQGPGLAAAQASPQLAAVRSANRAAVARMESCPWFAVCNGGCPHDRYTGERRLPSYDGGCCGFASLLAEMADTLRAAGLPVSAGPGSPPIQAPVPPASAGGERDRPEHRPAIGARGGQG